MACGGDDFVKKIQILEFFFSFYFITLTFLCYYCSINLKRQSEHSGLRPDTSSLVYWNKTDSSKSVCANRTKLTLQKASVLKELS